MVYAIKYTVHSCVSVVGEESIKIGLIKMEKYGKGQISKGACK